MTDLALLSIENLISIATKALPSKTSEILFFELFAGFLVENQAFF